MRNIKKTLALLFCFSLLVPILHPEQEKPFRRKLSFKLAGGGGFAFIGSVNRSLRLLNKNETFQDLRKNDPDSISGELRGLNNWLADWEVELRMGLSPKISIGIATSAPYHSRKESSLSYAMFEDEKRGPRIKTLLYRPEARVSIPIKLNLYYSRRYWKKPKLTLNAGIGYYPARLSQYSSVWIDNAFWSEYLEVKAKFPIGVHGGISLEYPVLKNLFMVMDIQARYVSLGNLQGRWELKNSDGIVYYEQKGTLYTEEVADIQIPAYYEQLVIYETPTGYARNATLDLTGFVLRVGIRVPLF